MGKLFSSSKSRSGEAEELDPDSVLGQIFAQQLVIVDTLQSLVLHAHKLRVEVREALEEFRGRKEPNGSIQTGEERAPRTTPHKANQ